MEIGKINDSFINNSVDTTKNKVQDDSFDQRLKSAMNSKDEKELRKACDDFEAIMLNMMYRQMKATVQKSDLIPEDTGNEIFNSMLDDELMKEASKARGMGLADVLYKQLTKKLGRQEKAVNEGVSQSENER